MEETTQLAPCVPYKQDFETLPNLQSDMITVLKFRLLFRPESS